MLMEKLVLVNQYCIQYSVFGHVLWVILFIEDINECNTGNGNCSQVCSNTIGSYMCSCMTGYVLNADGRGCRGK